MTFFFNLSIVSEKPTPTTTKPVKLKRTWLTDSVEPNLPSTSGQIKEETPFVVKKENEIKEEKDYITDTPYTYESNEEANEDLNLLNDIKQGVKELKMEEDKC